MSIVQGIVLSLCCVGLQTQDKKDEEERPGWEPPKAELPDEVDDATAKAAIKAFKKSFKQSKKAEDKITVIDGLIKSRNPLMVKVLGKALRDKSSDVREFAAFGLGKLAYPKAEKTLLSALRASRNADKGPVREAIARALAHSVMKPQFKRLGKDFQQGDRFTKKGLVLLFGQTKDEAALDALSDWIERPAPASVNSPSNPPASYWRKKHQEWGYIKREVEWAIWNITGKVFESKDDYRAWKRATKKAGKKKRRKS